MKTHFKLVLAIALTAITTFVVTAHFSTKNSWAAFVAKAYDMEVFNDIHRIESWDRLEQLLLNGCNKEALEYVRMEQSLGLSSLKWHLDNGGNLENNIEEEKALIVNRAKSFTGNGKYDIPTCK